MTRPRTNKNRENRKLVQINAENITIQSTPSEKLLGLNVNENLKWHDHIIKKEKSLLKSLITKSNAFSQISRFATFKTRLMVANSIFNSTMIYMIPVWGGTDDFILRALEVLRKNTVSLSISAPQMKLLNFSD